MKKKAMKKASKDSADKDIKMAKAPKADNLKKKSASKGKMKRGC